MTKYNSGDRVKVTSVNSPEHTGYLIGKTGTVKRPHREHPLMFDVEVMVDGIGERLFKDSQVELVSHVKKFKIGDEVLITGVQPLGDKSLIGKTGIVNGNDLGWTHLTVSDGNAYCVTVEGDDGLGFFENQLEFKENKKVEDANYSVNIENISTNNMRDLTSLAQEFIEIMNEVPDSGDLTITVGESTISIYRE